MIFEENDIFVMAGDSVTDCGRMYESLPGGWGSFGDGYVNFVDAFLNTLYPELKIMVANKGVSGNDILLLDERWDSDVLALNPDWVSVMIGINDVWRRFDGIMMNIHMVDEIEFEETYRKIIDRTLPRVKGMILISPIMIERSDENPMKAMLREYSGIAKKLAFEYKEKGYNMIWVDVQPKIDEFLSVLNEYILCSDRVHPNNKGHAIISKAVLDAIGVDWNR